MTFVTYLGLFMSWRSPSAQLQLVARWGIGFLVFLFAIAIFGTPKNVSHWAGNLSVVGAGALYFLVLAALEASGLYLRVIPRNAGRLYEGLRKGKSR